MSLPRLSRVTFKPLRLLQQARSLSSAAPATPNTSPFAPRHFLGIADLTPQELTTLLRNASLYKTAIKSGNIPENLHNSLLGQTIALSFSKRSTRTRVSSEAAIARLGGHAMFLSSSDIQLGVNESLYDTSVVISSMVSAIIARVDEHSTVEEMAKHSSVPVINALSDLYHPLQTLADYLTITEAFPTSSSRPSLGLEGLKIAWVGDANNVLFDLAIGAAKLGIELAVATPGEYSIPDVIRQQITASASSALPLKFSESTVPEEAVKHADVIVTDTWVSMGQEAEKEKRLRDFADFRVTRQLAERGGAKEGWRFMHCLPRHPEEVEDEVFYSPASLVFQEAENRLWSAMAALDGFVVKAGKIC